MGIFMKTTCKGVFNTEQYIQGWVTIAMFPSSVALPAAAAAAKSLQSCPTL